MAAEAAARSASPWPCWPSAPTTPPAPWRPRCCSAPRWSRPTCGRWPSACDVVTFDHEQVDLDIVRPLIDEGVVIRPGAQTLELAVDKAHMRARPRRGRRRPCPALRVPRRRRRTPLAEVDRALRRRPRLAARAQDGPGRLRRQGRLAGRRPRRGGGRSSGHVDGHGPASKSSSRSRPSSPSWSPAVPRERRSPGRPSRRPRSAGVCREVLVPGACPPTWSRRPRRSGSRSPRSPAPSASWRSSSSGRAGG